MLPASTFCILGGNPVLRVVDRWKVACLHSYGSNSTNLKSFKCRDYELNILKVRNELSNFYSFDIYWNPLAILYQSFDYLWCFLTAISHIDLSSSRACQDGIVLLILCRQCIIPNSCMYMSLLIKVECFFLFSNEYCSELVPCILCSQVGNRRFFFHLFSTFALFILFNHLIFNELVLHFGGLYDLSSLPSPRIVRWAL